LKVAITGGAGFIGSTVTLRLAEEAFEVLSFDNNWRYGYGHLAIPSNCSITLLNLDITKEKQVARFFKRYRPDVIVHLAAIPGERLCAPYYKSALSTNVLGTYLLLKNSLAFRPKLFVFASSQVVYGPPKYVPVDEEHPRKATDLYSLTKITGEDMCQMFFEKHNLPIITLRFSSVYGFGAFARWQEVTGKFVRLALDGKDLPVCRPPNLGDFGAQIIDFVHVRDLANAILKIIKAVVQDCRHSLLGETFNVGYGEGHSIAKLAEMVVAIAKERLDKDIRILKVESSEDEIPEMVLCIKKITEKIGWKPEITLRDGLLDLMEKYLSGRTEIDEKIKTPERIISNILH
jgi:UDP-glucose 4-epimerase